MDISKDKNTGKEDEEDVLLFTSKEPILSGEELIKVFNSYIDRKSTNSTTSSSILEDIESGTKLNNPTGSWLEAKRIEARHRNLYEHVSVPKVAQRAQLSEAVWDGSVKKARVTKPCGKHWNTVGHLYQNELYIFSEEALFLIECNSLELIYGREGVAMSLQQAFQILIMDKNSDCTLEGYLTYSRLVRLGYKVLRHQGNLGIGISNRQRKGLENCRSQHGSKVDLCVLSNTTQISTTDRKVNASEKPEEIIALSGVDMIIDSDLENTKNVTHVDQKSLNKSREVLRQPITNVVRGSQQTDSTDSGSLDHDEKSAADRKEELRINPAIVDDESTLRACLNQPGPSWLGNFVEEEIVAAKTDANREQFKNRRLIEYSNEDITRKTDSTTASNESYYSICKDILLHLIENVVDSTQILQVQNKNDNNCARVDGIHLKKWKIGQKVTMEEFEQDCGYEDGRIEEGDVCAEEDVDCDKDTYGNDKSSSMSQQDCDEIEVLSYDEISRLDALSMVPNCYKRNKVTLTVPSLDLLPYRAWPKKNIYIIEIRRPQLFKAHVSPLKVKRNKKEDTSAITIDDDIEIVDVIPPQGVQAFSAREEKQDDTDCKLVAENTHVPLEGSSDNPQVVGFQSEFSTSIIRDEVHESTLSHPYLNENLTELRKRVYSKMIHRDYKGPSRGFYIDQNCLSEPAVQGFSYSRAGNKRSFNSETCETFHHATYNTRSLVRDQVGIDLNFRPTKRFPIMRQNQCLPCDAQWLTNLLKENQGDEGDNHPPRTKYPLLYRDSQECLKEKNRSKHRKDSSSQVYIPRMGHDKWFEYKKGKIKHHRKWNEKQFTNETEDKDFSSKRKKLPIIGLHTSCVGGGYDNDKTVEGNQELSERNLEIMSVDVSDVDFNEIYVEERQNKGVVIDTDGHDITADETFPKKVYAKQNINLREGSTVSVDLDNSSDVHRCYGASCIEEFRDEGVNCDINVSSTDHLRYSKGIPTDVQEVSDRNRSDLPPSLIQGPLAKLWGAKTTPLLQPVHAKNTAKVLSKLDLQLDKQKFISISSPSIKNVDGENITSPFRVWYDVYLPKVPFRKSSPRLPNYRVTVCKPSDPLPTYQDVKMLTGSIANDDI